MSYQIILTNGTVLTTLPDTTVDNTTSLTLVGRNFAGYGTAVADNFVHLLENAANASPPAHPLVGQQWFNTATSIMNVWTGTAWFALTTGVSSVIGNTGAVTLSQLVTSGLAPLASPALTGVPTAPTASTGTATTQIATTQFVTAKINSLVSGVSSVLGFTGAVTLAQMVNGGLAPLGSPTLSGVPTAPTPAVGTNNTQIATTAFVIAQVGALSTGVSSVIGNTGAVTLAQLVAGGVAPGFNAALTGVPTAPTAAAGTNTNQLATTAFIQASNSSLLGSNNTWTGINTYNVGPVLANNIYLSAKDTAAAPHGIIGMDSGNNTAILGGPSGLIRMYNGNNVLVQVNAAGATQFSGGVTTTGLDPAGVAQFRAMSPNYGFMIRNDDANSYFLLTNRGDPFGGNNGFTPLRINNQTAAVAIDGTGAGVTIGGAVTALSTIQASSNITSLGRLRAAFGAYHSGDNQAAVLLGDFTFNAATDGYQIFPNGMILQWGITTIVSTGTGITGANVTIPVTFPNSHLYALAAYSGNAPNSLLGAIAGIPASNNQLTITMYTTGATTAGVKFLSIGY